MDGSSERDERCSCSEARAHLERFLDHGWLSFWLVGNPHYYYR